MLVRLPGVVGLVVAVVVAAGRDMAMGVAVLVQMLVGMGMGMGMAVHLVAVLVLVGMDVAVLVGMLMLVLVPQGLAMIVMMAAMHDQSPVRPTVTLPILAERRAAGDGPVSAVPWRELIQGELPKILRNK